MKERKKERNKKLTKIYRMHIAPSRVVNSKTDLQFLRQVLARKFPSRENMKVLGKNQKVYRQIH